MKIIDDAGELTHLVTEWRKDNHRIGLVPTMGCFHQGHLTLMQESKKRSDKTVVTLFVNPRQFGPQEDLAKYPRDLHRDARLAEDEGVDILFSPPVEIMYPVGYQTNVSVKFLSQHLCGQSRPGHFDGVATIVTKLFNLVRPDVAVFGEKDYQQLAVIKQLNRDLHFNIDIVGHPIVREADGLAMSSRNKYLDAAERKLAACLYDALEHARNRVARNGNSIKSEDLISELSGLILVNPGFSIDYISIVDKTTLVPSYFAEQGKIVAMAVFVNQKVRLIDNTEL